MWWELQWNGERGRVLSWVSELSVPSCLPVLARDFIRPAYERWYHSQSLFLPTRLDTNQFQDPVMELLGSVLSGKDCRIQRIR